MQDVNSEARVLQRPDKLPDLRAFCCDLLINGERPHVHGVLMRETRLLEK